MVQGWVNGVWRVVQSAMGTGRVWGALRREGFDEGNH